MKIVIAEKLALVSHQYLDFKVVDEHQYRKALDNDVTYDKKQEKWIDLLAFKEALASLKLELDNNEDVIFVFNRNEQKIKLLNKLLGNYHYEKISG